MSVTRVAILGATGSIGQLARDVVASHPDRFELVGMAAGTRVEPLAEAASQEAPWLRLRWLNVATAEARERLEALLPPAQKAGVEITVGEDGLVAMAQAPEADLVDRKSTRLNSSHVKISYAVFCLKKKTSIDSMV